MPKWLSSKRLILMIISVILLFIISYATYLYVNFKTTMEEIHSPITTKTNVTPTTTTQSPEKNPLAESTYQKSDVPPSPITLLLLGIDQYESSVGRADTILVLTVNPQTETIKMLSIPRDTYTEIAGLDFSDKINHSYAFGGMEMAHATVENFLQIPIDYVVTINMEGFTDLIDSLKGIELINDYAFSTDLRDYPEGKLTLSGEEALDFVRMRYEDPLGDFGRQNRQRLVVESLLKELSSLNIVWQVPSVLELIRNNVETNVTFDDIKYFVKSYKPALNNFEQLTFDSGEGHLQSGIWYYFTSEEEVQSIRNTLVESLSIDE